MAYIVTDNVLNNVCMCVMWAPALTCKREKAEKKEISRQAGCQKEEIEGMQRRRKQREAERKEGRYTEKVRPKQ